MAPLVLRPLALATLLAAIPLQLTACCGSSGGKPCTSTIRYKGKSYEARSDASDARSEATRLACRRYCKTDDPDVQAAWRTWKSSPEGAKSTSEPDFEMEVRTALFTAINKCQNACVAEMVLTPTLASVSCEK